MTDISLSRSVNWPPARVWRAWTDPGEFAAWFWPPSFETAAACEASQGGSYRVSSPVAGIGITGTYLHVEPPARLTLTWQWDGETEQSTVDIELTAAGGGTSLEIRHHGLASKAVAAEHAQGWNDCLDRLPGHLATVP